MNYKEVIESRYNRQNWQLLLHDIFGNKIKFWNTPSSIPTSSQFAKQALWLGTITLSDNQTISVYEVELSDSVDIERNRRGIRDMLLTDWRNNGNAGAFMFCYRKNESVLRFSYVSEAWTFADDGSYQKESTDAKRFTYLLGEGHRSRTAIQQFEKLRDSSLTLKDLTKAFSVDAVSDMFFDGYKKQYEDIIQYITGKRMVKVANKWEEQIKNDPCEEIMQEFAHFSNPEKAVRDYVKKLMGRLVFLQFLQKKGWLGVPVGAEWGTGDAEFIQTLFAQCQDKDHFIDNVLESLFNDLNSENEKQLPQYRTPYLNGGLFERDATDETEFPLPAKYMLSLLDFFASYNFTIDENDPDDAEVGVDPEMLGRIFENLLEDNKDKGAFYTPKEIVSYMCRESLIAYLQTGIEDEATKEAIRQFVTTHDVNALGANNRFRQQVDEALCNVKICDPAIGSGAFPMGLLKELFQCRTALEGISQHQAAEIKKHIIQQNIYGVDIERGAVDIARLRFWLSLIVDEETPQALPNLDYKIVEGNSLITTFDGKYIDLSTNIGTSRLRSSLVRIRPEKKALQAEQRRFFTLSGDEKYRSEIAIKNHILNIIWYQLDYEKHSWEDATIEQAGLFGATTTKGRKKNSAKVVEFTQERQMVLDKCEKLMAELNDKNISLQERAGINIPFFEWETVFSEVFDDDNKKGFDIIIANPPYIRVQNLDYDTIDLLKKLYKVAFKRLDISLCFIELAHNICKLDSGAICYITSNQFLTTEYGKEMRSFILNEQSLKSCVDLADLPIFSDALTYVSIFSFMNNCPSNFFKYYYSNTMDNVRRMHYDNVKEIHYTSLSSDNWNLKGNDKTMIFEKMCRGNKRLEEIGHCNAGLITGSDKVMMFKDTDLNSLPFEKNLLLPVLRAENCNKYMATKPTKYVIYPYCFENGKTKILTEERLKENFPKAYSYLLKNKDVLLNRKDSRKTIGEKSSWFGLVRFGRLDMFEQPKIISPGEVLEHKFCIDYSHSGFSCARVFAITIEKEFDIRYILALLNSNAMKAYIQSIASLKNGGYYQYSANILNRCPIPTPSEDQNRMIVDLVDSITNKKKSGDNTSALESEIDRLVYQLYGLTEEEIKIIEESYK